MKSRNSWFVIVLAMVASTGVFAQGNGNGGGNRNRPPSISNPLVRASFAYCGGDTDCEAANRVRQDTAAQYVHGQDGVSAEFNLGSGSRDLTINMLTSQRFVTLDFRVVVNEGTTVPAWWASTPQKTVKAFVNVLGAYYAKENCPPAASECSYQARMNLGGWSVSGDNSSYALLWNPLAVGRPVNSPATTSYVDVHYIRDDGSGEVFVITPILTGAGYALAGLEQTSKKVVKGAGQYNMPFALTVRPK